MKKTILLSLMSAFLLSYGHAQDCKQQQAASPVLLDYKYFDGNDIQAWITNDGGFADFRPLNSAGMFWPKGTTKTAIYTAGFCLVGMERSSLLLRTSAVFYDSENRPGVINGTFSGDTSVASNPSDTLFHIYKISKSDTVGSVNPDYDHWPAKHGAPVDARGIPKFLGDQQLYSVYNDINSRKHALIGTTPPMGLEYHSLTYGSASLNNVMFLHLEIINKSIFTYDSTYVTIFSDEDLGGSNDDMTGCDTLLDLGYVYNGNNEDPKYGATPPAVGFTFLRTPGSRSGNTHLMTSFVPYFCGDTTFYCPPLGRPEFAAYLFNNSQGRSGRGFGYVNPATGRSTPFIFSGDPVMGSGWLQPKPREVYTLMCSGPFTLAAGDTQVVDAALLIAQGSDRLASVTALRELTKSVRTSFGIPTPVNHTSGDIPHQYTLYQNSPNPFNPSTVVRYSTGSSGFVTLKVYDVLGREVATLVNEPRPAGTYTATFDGSHLATGVYLYQLRAGDFVQTKRMALVK